MIIEHNSDNPVILGETPVLLDFYAIWCGPCKVTGKYLEEFSEKHPEITIYKINVDEQPDIAETFSVTNLPTLIYTNLDEILWRHIGLITVKQLEEKINESKLN